jgi:hypothetical protein
VPKVFDTEQTLRILGADGKESYETVNKRDPMTGKVINDLSKGRFDTAITVGPSYATRRMEAAEAYTQMAGVDEGLMLSAGDLVYKAMDLPYAQEIAERRQALLPPPVQKMLTEGKNLPPEVMAAMNQVEQMSAMVDEKGKLITAAEQELKDVQAKAQGQQAQAKLASANLQTQEVQFQAQFDKLELAKRDFSIAQQQLANERAMLDIHVKNQLLTIENAKLKATHTVTEAIHHHENTERDVSDAVKDGSHQLENQKRDVQETAKDASHGLEKQATQMSVANMQASHKQDLKQAKTKATKPKK